MMNDFWLRLYEAQSPTSYPIDLVWQAGGTRGFFWQRGMAITDTDGDGREEVVSGGLFFDDQERVVVYENDGDNSYDLTYTDVVRGDIVGQSLAVLEEDLDGDGRQEIVHGGIQGAPGAQSLTCYESTADDSYAISWTWEFIPHIDLQFIVDAGDLDGDGRKEILTGGLKPNAPNVSHLHILEATGDNRLQDVALLVRPNGNSYSSAAVADVDGDGRREIVFGTHNQVAIYENDGDNSWHEIWSGAGSEVESIGAGDHDADGMDEILFRGGNVTNGTTGVWEIDEAYAADMDTDGRVDAIDNCATVWNPEQEDTDADAVGDACDNCIWGPNPAQGPAVFGHTLLATGPSTFGWASPAPVAHVRGSLAGVGAYAWDLFGTLPPGVAFFDADQPAGGAGFYYLVKPSCFVGSWQSELGAEPGRDEALP